MANARVTLDPRALVDDQPTLFSYLDADLRHRFASGAYETWFGKSQREVVGRSVRDVLPRAMSREAEPFFERALCGERVQFETALELAASRKRVVVSLVPDFEEGGVRGLFVLIHDVTGRIRNPERLPPGPLPPPAEVRRRSAELERAHDKLRFQADLVDALDEPVVVSDTHLQIIGWNRAAERTYGWSASEVVGKRLVDVLETEFVGETLEGARRTLRATDRFRGEVVHTTRSGERVREQVSVSPLYDGGQRVGAVSVSRNVEEEHRIREELRHGEAQMRAREEEIRRERDFVERLIDTAPVAVLVLDREGAIVRYNRFLEEMSGVPLADARGASWFERFLPARTRTRTERLFRGILNGAVESGVVDSIKTQSGDERLFEWHNSTLTDDDGTVLGVLAIGRDITERRELEEKFLQAQKMEAIGRLASGIAHDFNNLLMGVMGCAEMAKKRLEPASAAEPFIEEIARAAGSGASITRELLNFTRKRREPNESCDVRAVVDREWTMLRRLVGEDVELVSHVADAELSVACGEGKLEQILMNLAVNARDAMRDGGSLRIEAEPVELDGEAARRYPGLRPGRYVSLRVSDSGVGMDSETLEHAFEPFFSTKATGEGTGLGLSTVYAIASGAGGSVDAESAPGEGTTFHILLPRSERSPEPAPSEASDVPSVRGEGQVALVVEDEPLVRRTVRHYLEPRGFEVIEAEDGEAALAALDELTAPLALLVTDIVLPGRSGTEIAEVISAREPSVATVLMSAHPRGVLAERGRLSPGSVSLQKPFGEADLTRAIARAIGAGKSRDAAGSGSGERTILLVEDSAAARLACRELLEDLGYRVLAAKNGAEASELAQAGESIDLIVTDVGLPDVSGSDLVAELRAGAPGPPVLYVSGLGPDDPALERALSLPGTSYVAKPVDFAVLAEQVEALLER